MWLWRLLRFVLCAVPAAALAVAVPWAIFDPLVRLGVPEDPVVYQICIIVSATVLMVGVAAAWHIAGWSLVGPSDDVPRVLRENSYPAAVVILLLIALAWGIAAATAAANVVDAIAQWGFVGQIVAGALVVFVLSMAGIGWKLVCGDSVTKQEIAERTPALLKIVAALLLSVAQHLQSIGKYLADRLPRRRGT